MLRAMAERMIELLLLAGLGSFVAAIYCLIRGFRMFGTMRPAAATVWRSDYTDAQRREDFWSFGTIGTQRGFNWQDGQNARLIEDEIRFTTADGRQHATLVHRRVRRGWTPSSSYVVWYYPANPARVTAMGPYAWFGYALLAAFGCVLLGYTWLDAGGPLPFAT